jgi:hypothetical protein
VRGQTEISEGKQRGAAPGRFEKRQSERRALKGRGKKKYRRPPYSS